MKSSETVLITGASGFIGTWLADEAKKAGYNIVGVDLRAPFRPGIWSAFHVGSCETVDLSAITDAHAIRAVFHLAGGANVGASVADPYGDFSSLLPGTARLATHVAKACPGARFFLFSSAAVYGNPRSLPIHESAEIAPISPYGAHKAVTEQLLGHYARILGLRVTVFRIFSVYGPGLRKQLIWDICQKVKTARAEGRDHITLWGTGRESRDFIHVSDICRAALTVLGATPGSAFELFNVSTGVESTIEEVASTLVSALGGGVRVEFNGQVSKGDPVNWRADVAKLVGLGFKPRVSLRDGLDDVARWSKSGE